MIIGTAGACRKDELTKLLIENVTDEGAQFHVRLPNTKTKILREFCVTSGGIEGVNLVEMVRSFLSLRPPHTPHGRFFVFFKNGKCTTQPVGINTFGAMPKKIACFLCLNEPEKYTGHAFRRTSASLLADSGADLLMVKRHGGWKSSSVAEGYIDTSKGNKKIVAQHILGSRIAEEACQPECEPNRSTAQSITVRPSLLSSSSSSSAAGIVLKKCKKCVINIYNN